MQAATTRVARGGGNGWMTGCQASCVEPELHLCAIAALHQPKSSEQASPHTCPYAAVTDAIRQVADGRQMTFDEAAQEKRLPDSAELPIDVGQHQSSADPAYNEAAAPFAAELEPELPGLPSRETTAGAAEPADSRRLRAGRAAAGPAQRASGAEGPSAPAAGRLPAVGSTAGNQAQAQGGPASQAQLPLSAATEVAQQREADSPSDGPPEAATAAGDPEEPATDSDSQDLAEEDEVLLFTAWVRERLEQQAQEADAPSEGGGEGQATLAPSRREEDGPHMISGYSGGFGSNTAGCGHFLPWQRVLSYIATMLGCWAAGAWTRPAVQGNLSCRTVG